MKHFRHKAYIAIILTFLTTNLKSQNMASKQNPDWLDKNEYPFQSNYIEIDGHQIHYADEGKGQILLMVHGIPDWSFSYRHLIKDLSKNYRCIALDNLGYG